ncbi:DUF4136 domain-containing protein [Shewanella sp. MMG014]|uniref:DUF4136 domain-containing protein n=1 Tax=Shewanella sp. MMG014 TaxID=2822691 RepID=UPI001B37F8DE|nr:DUF4136 domain-containing protein [Shewanella sp. MMG014]MBQ4888384.1 DUF4136 domain-containing protein [Shewanella sp. MMG014]
MNSKKWCLWISLFAVLISGCATKEEVNKPAPSRITMVTSGDLSFISSQVKSFAWHPTMFTVHSANKLDDAELVRHMRQSITKIMEQKGYHFAKDNENPNVLIGFGMALESEMSDAEIMKRAGLVAGLSTSGIDDDFEKGSVLVALFSPNRIQPIWKVLAQGFTETGKPIEDREIRFDKLTGMMLSSIPNHTM